MRAHRRHLQMLRKEGKKKNQRQSSWILKTHKSVNCWVTYTRPERRKKTVWVSFRALRQKNRRRKKKRRFLFYRTNSCIKTNCSDSSCLLCPHWSPYFVLTVSSLCRPNTGHCALTMPSLSPHYALTVSSLCRNSSIFSTWVLNSYRTSKHSLDSVPNNGRMLNNLHTRFLRDLHTEILNASSVIFATDFPVKLKLQNSQVLHREDVVTIDSANGGNKRKKRVEKNIVK